MLNRLRSLTTFVRYSASHLFAGKFAYFLLLATVLFLAVVIIPNLFALLLLSGQVVKETRSYFTRKPWLENERKHKELKRSGRL